MKQISVGQFSTIIGSSFKASQVEPLSGMLAENGMLSKLYGLYSKGEVKINKELYFTTKLPVLLMRIFEKTQGFKLIPNYYSRILAEALYDFIVSLKLKNDLSKIFYTSPRSNRSIKAAKALGKKILLDVGEMHPYFTCEQVSNEYKKYGIKHKFIYTNRYAVEKFKQSIDLADYIITLSESSKRSFIENGVTNKPIYVINLGGKKAKDNIDFCQDKQFAFLSTAYHSFVKGTHTLLLAWKKAKIENAKLILVGDLHRDIKEFISRYGPFEGVEYVGLKKIDDYYPNFNGVGILASLSEGYSRVVAEYMAHGFSVIVTPVATCDIVENGKHGLIVQKSNISELAEAIKYINNHRLEALAMGQYAKMEIGQIKDVDYPAKVLKVIENIF